MLLSISFYTSFFKSGIDRSTEWSTIPTCPSLMCSFNRGNAEGTNSSKIVCLMFVYVLFYFLENLCFDDLCAEERDRLKIEDNRRQIVRLF